MKSEIAEVKIYKLLYGIQQNMLSRIMYDAQNIVQFSEGKPELTEKLINMITTPSKWDYYGFVSKEDKRLMEVLGYLLDDEAKDIGTYKDFKKQ